MNDSLIWNRRFEQLGSAKVRDLNAQIVRHEQVLRLQVAMHMRRGRRVEVVHAIGRVDAEAYLLIQGKRRLLLLYDRHQRSQRDVFGDNEGCLVF